MLVTSKNFFLSVYCPNLHCVLATDPTAALIPSFKCELVLYLSPSPMHTLCALFADWGVGSSVQFCYTAWVNRQIFFSQDGAL